VTFNCSVDPVKCDCWARAPEGPSAPELRAAIKEAVKSKFPDLLLTQIQEHSKGTWDGRKPKGKQRQREGAGNTSGRGTKCFHLFLNTVACWADSQPAEML
jgi:hypothetical protein